MFEHVQLILGAFGQCSDEGRSLVAVTGFVFSSNVKGGGPIISRIT